MRYQNVIQAPVPAGRQVIRYLGIMVADPTDNLNDVINQLVERGAEVEADYVVSFQVFPQNGHLWGYGTAVNTEPPA
jgi:hypothetical protein